MTVNISTAEKVYGWMLPEELLWLATQAQSRQRIVEIGSYVGRSTRALADNTPGNVLAVDTWNGSVEHESDLHGKQDGFLLDRFLSNTMDLVKANKIEPMRMCSTDAAAKCREQGRQFDMIFIDASHLYADVRADIEAWKPLLAPGGILCGHDFSRYSGLDQAVRECAPRFRLMPYPGSIWYTGVTLDGGRILPFGERQVSKMIFTLNIGMNFAPEVCSITYPMMRLFADKCGATLNVITERKFPDCPITMEKLQVYELAREWGADWNMYFDSDALIHPDTYDPTEHLHKDTVLHNGKDMAGNRWRYDNYFRRDGRHIGSGNWFTVASDWCLDLWHPPDETVPEMLSCITPTAYERAHGITEEHLIDDYILSRNIARYGLKFCSYMDITRNLGRSMDEYFWHHYTVPIEDKLMPAIDLLPKEDSEEFKSQFYMRDGQVMLKGKLTLMKEVLKRWGIGINQPPVEVPVA